MKYVLLEMDRILRRNGYALIRESSYFMDAISTMTKGMKWGCRKEDTEYDVEKEKIIARGPSGSDSHIQSNNRVHDERGNIEAKCLNKNQEPIKLQEISNSQDTQGISEDKALQRNVVGIVRFPDTINGIDDQLLSDGLSTKVFVTIMGGDMALISFEKLDLPIVVLVVTLLLRMLFRILILSFPITEVDDRQHFENVIAVPNIEATSDTQCDGNLKEHEDVDELVGFDDDKDGSNEGNILNDKQTHSQRMRGSGRNSRDLEETKENIEEDWFSNLPEKNKKRSKKLNKKLKLQRTKSPEI
ncbi:putative S-adenosyl-L-methionine-dependent methyltransferase protein [Corchorus capsularis]|uniref:Putative S-adenosyl-L-methionine-dependent methyltransferase protein n=1 Tax=Corchorus capsularis TaxID=210143 RepID=A0A1R3J8W2_COCAP|nr:putative S-adenosyl-L-methionine-dependent methyltransferase protein [Corchorus capsularis]